LFNIPEEHCFISVNTLIAALKQILH